MPTPDRYYYEYDTKPVVTNDRMWIIYDRVERFGRGDPMEVAKCWRKERAEQICRLLNREDD